MTLPSFLPWPQENNGKIRERPGAGRQPGHRGARVPPEREQGVSQVPLRAGKGDGRHKGVRQARQGGPGQALQLRPGPHLVLRGKIRVRAPTAAVRSHPSAECARGVEGRQLRAAVYMPVGRAGLPSPSQALRAPGPGPRTVSVSPREFCL